MKNIERIKEMSVKELTKFLNESMCNYCSYKNKDCGNEMCSIGIEEWLNQESDLTINDVYGEYDKFCCTRNCLECEYPDDTCLYNFLVDHFNIINGKITRKSK